MVNHKAQIAKWSKIFTETQPNGLHPNAKRHKKAHKMLEHFIRSLYAFDRTKWAQNPVPYCKNMLKKGFVRDLNMLDILLEPHKTEIQKKLDSMVDGCLDNHDNEMVEWVMGQPYQIIINNIMFIEAQNIDLTQYFKCWPAVYDSEIVYRYYTLIEKKKENKKCNECIMKDIIETKTQFDAKVST
tara:strand:- start:231 stop:785 length:555 start_codon:yes stop_codon:yes gene_type:complete